MNQSIQFPDQQTWHAALGIITFPALNMGQLLQCQISLAGLNRYGECDNSEASVLALFEQTRFDLEDLAEAKIVAEDFDQQGVINLG